jgi:putative ABC transport system permease protein
MEGASSMSFARFVARNCWRRPLRAIVTAAGIAVAVGAAFSFLSFQYGYQLSLRQDLNRLGAHILVVPKGCPYEAASLALHGANWPCYLKESYLEEIRFVPGIAAIAPAFMAALYESNSIPTVYVGIDTNMLALKPGWRIRGTFPNINEVLIGSEIAQRHGWTNGQSVPLPGLAGAACRISGILMPTQSADDTFMFLRLKDAQQLFRHANSLTHVLVRLNDVNMMDKVVSALRGCDAGMQMNVIPLAHLFRTIQSLANSTRWFLACATLVALIAAAAGVSAALLIAITERKREVGVMRALGASRANVFWMFWFESSVISAVGASVGVLLAFAAAGILESWLRARLPFAPHGALMIWQWWIAAACLGGTIVLGGVAAWLPSWRAATLTPIEAMRN